MAILSRIMVGLPSAENRERILKTILAKENHGDIDFKELSTMTEGYSGSDLKVQFVQTMPLRSACDKSLSLQMR
jgi:SpoVK/Ycf46/Vps4 family AAA+-type ATPase